MSGQPAFDKFAYIRALRGAGLTSSEYRVLMIVLSYTDNGGHRAYASVARLARDCELSERTVQLCRASLLDKGFLRRVRRGGRSGDGVVRASEYDVCLPMPASIVVSTGNPLPVDPVDNVVSTGNPLPVDPVDNVSQPATECVSTGNQLHPIRSVSGPKEKRGSPEPGTSPREPLSPTGPPPPNSFAEQQPGEPPLRYCPEHMPGGTSRPCGPCKNQRFKYEAWERAAVAADAVAERMAVETNRVTMAACPHCDDEGWRKGPDGELVEPAVKCNHRPFQGLAS